MFFRVEAILMRGARAFFFAALLVFALNGFDWYNTNLWQTALLAGGAAVVNLIKNYREQRKNIRLSLPFFEQPTREIELLPAGEAAKTFTPGDFILTHQELWTSRIIQWGQGLRIHGEDRKYTYWNHAAIIVDEGGKLVEALGRGVCSTNISNYKYNEYHLVRIVATDDDRVQMINFAKTIIGMPYGFLTILSIALKLITGGKVNLSFENDFICSGLVAQALERGSAIFNRTTSHIMPADLAKYYGVTPPSISSTLSH